jgi:hypothetical protein
MSRIGTAAVAAVVSLVAAVSLTAQPLTIGKMTPRGLFTVSNEPPTLTWIDVSHAAPRSGTIGGLSVRWSGPAGAPCVNAYSARIVRASSVPGAWTIVANLGTYNSDNELVTLPAPVNVQAGDLLAVTALKAIQTCGAFVFSQGSQSDTVIRIPADLTNNVAPTFSNYAHGVVLNALAWQSISTLTATLPVVGSAPGNFGAFFRTSLQLSNADTSRQDVRIVFHPQAQSAQASDPSLSVTLLPGRSVAYNDILATMGLTGIGSLDIYGTGGKGPVVTARVFNDNGAAGTQGFTEEAVTREHFMVASQYGELPYPADPANFRMNLGVRTFDDGATVQFTGYDATGAFRGSLTKTYGPNYFEQFNAAALAALTDGWISVYVTAGSAVVYGSYTDNRTNDSNMKYAMQP